VAVLLKPEYKVADNFNVWQAATAILLNISEIGQYLIKL